MKSAQLAAYIARSINIIGREYDAVKIKTILEKLAERFSRLDQLRKQDKESGEKGRARKGILFICRSLFSVFPLVNAVRRQVNERMKPNI